MRQPKLISNQPVRLVINLTAQYRDIVKIRHVKQDSHGHLLFLYESPDERLQTLGEYFRDGLAKGELCVFVTPHSSRKVVKDLKSVGLNVATAVKQGHLRIFEMEKTYLPHGKFVADYMLLNVANFIMEAKAKGYTGVRTAGEMAWLYEHPEFLADATHYESQVNELNAANPAFTGLCLYPVRRGFGKILDSALRTHPSYVYDGTPRTNPFNNEGLPANKQKMGSLQELWA